MRAKRQEIMVAFDLNFIVIIIQRWASAGIYIYTYIYSISDISVFIVLCIEDY